MAEYEPGRSKTEDVLIDQLKELRLIREGQPSGEYQSTEGTQTLFVSKGGDNSDGLTWITAYNCPRVAALSVPNDLNELIHIIIANGEYDVDFPDDGIMPGAWRKLFFEGLSREDVIITNQHTGASGVMAFNAPTILKNLTISPQDSIRGIEFDEGADNSSLEHINIKGRCVYDTDDILGPSACLQLWDVKHCNINDVILMGATGATVAIEVLNGARYNNLKDIKIVNCREPILMGGTGTHNNNFECLVIEDSMQGSQIASGCWGNHFRNIKIDHTQDYIDGLTGNLRDFGDNNHFKDISITPKRLEIIPNNLVGITSSSNAVIGTYGNWIQFATPDTQFIPKYIRFINPSVNGIYRVQVTRNLPREDVMSEILEINGGFFMGDAKARIEWANEEVYDANEEIWIRVTTDQAGVDTIQAFLTVELI